MTKNSEEVPKNTHGGKRGGGRPALRRNKVRLAVEIEKDLLSRLKEVCKERGNGVTPMPRWMVVTEALKSHLARYILGSRG